tara:strand:+ start:137 stop:508 length:372 start_codon:yes stop_codon:yes gene_type:complete
MKILRRTIRQILLENNAHYDKLAVMICSWDPSNMNQAIELAIALGYVDNVDYEKEEKKYAFSNSEEHWAHHRWTLIAVEEFEKVIMDYLRKNPPPDADHGIWRLRGKSDILIKASEKLGEEKW